MRTLFDKSAGADLDARSAPGGRGAGKHRVNPTLSANIQGSKPETWVTDCTGGECQDRCRVVCSAVSTGTCSGLRVTGPIGVQPVEIAGL